MLKLKPIGDIKTKAPIIKNLRWILYKAVELGFHVENDGTLKRNNVILHPTNYSTNSYIRLSTNFRYNNILYRVTVHQLQAFQKFGDKLFENGIVVRHLNGKSDDNSYDNIAIGTASDNRLDIPEHKRKEISAKANKKYNHKQVLDLHNKGFSYKEIMELTGIKSKSTINYILNNSFTILNNLDSNENITIKLIW